MAELILEDDISNVSFFKPRKYTSATSHYVDNKRLSDIMIEWRKECDIAKAAGKERPRIPEYVGKSIMDMAHNMGKRYNFRGYSWLDEMISDAILHTCKYIHNFNPFAKTKSGTPSAFSYINRILWRSFTHRIEAEDKEQYVKNKSFELLGGLDAFKDSDMEDAAGSDGDPGNGASVSMIGEELLRRAYEYEAKHGLGPKKKKVESTEVEDNLLLSFMEGLEPKDPDALNLIDDDYVVDDPIMAIIEEDFNV